MAEAKKTTDHDEIRRWVESRGGKPAHVAETGGGDDPGVLRIDFDEPGGNGDERLERMSWEEWFEKVDENRLASTRTTPTPASTSSSVATETR